MLRRKVGFRFLELNPRCKRYDFGIIKETHSSCRQARELWLNPNAQNANIIYLFQSTAPVFEGIIQFYFLIRH